MYDQFGIKELYEVAFKATDNMRIFNQDFEKNEVIMYFDNIQMSNINTSVDRRYAEGGKGNFPLVGWESVQAVDFRFENGLISKNGFNLLSQSTMRDMEIGSFGIPKRESLITDSNGDVQLKYGAAANHPVFAYFATGGIITEKITPISTINNIVSFGVSNAYKNVIIDYYFLNNEVIRFEIGGERIKGFMKMTAKIEAVDEKDGTRKTVLFSMPKMQLLSNLNLTLGIKANPIISTFAMRAFPDLDGKTLARFFFLNEDIEG